MLACVAILFAKLLTVGIKHQKQYCWDAKRVDDHCNHSGHLQVYVIISATTVLEICCQHTFFEVQVVAYKCLKYCLRYSWIYQENEGKEDFQVSAQQLVSGFATVRMLVVRRCSWGVI